MLTRRRPAPISGERQIFSGRCRRRELTTDKSPAAVEFTASTSEFTGRGVVVRERGGTPFRQIFWSRNGARANIVGYRWNANTEAFRQITSYS